MHFMQVLQKVSALLLIITLLMSITQAIGLGLKMYKQLKGAKKSLDYRISKSKNFKDGFTNSSHMHSTPHPKGCKCSKC